MQTLSIGELKSKFSEVLGQLRGGQKIIISYGKKKEKVAVLVPYSNYKVKPKRELGLLKEQGRCVIHKDFKMTDEDILNS